nr:right-handed parallel beta-helix repeat-containing protein [Candidatus Sigynarchaeota archaeon]
SVYTHEFSGNNTVEGIPVNFIKHQHGVNISTEFIQVFLINCSSVTLKNHHANVTSARSCGIYTLDTNDITITNITTRSPASTWAFFNSTNIMIDNCTVVDSFTGYNTAIACTNITITNSFYNRFLGWDITESSNITIENCTAVDLMGYWWVKMDCVNDAMLRGINCDLVFCAILIKDGANFTISSNEFINGSVFCSIEGRPLNIHMQNNTLLDSGAFITLEDMDDACLTYNFTEGNFINGKPILHVKDQQDMTYTVDAFQVFVFNSTNVTLQNMNFTNAKYPGFSYKTTGLHVMDCTFTNITSDVFRLSNVNATTIEGSTFSNTGGVCNAFQCNDISLHNATVVNQQGEMLLVNSSRISVTGTEFLNNWHIRAENVSDIALTE